MADSINKVALSLRLARILTGDTAPAQLTLSSEDSDCLKFLDQLLVGMEERIELLRLPEETQLPEVPVVIEEEDVGRLPVDVTDEGVPDIPEEAVIWGRQHDLLYEDVLWLFKMGDNAGAIGSLSRLMDLGEGTEEIDRFLDINREKLITLFQRLVGEAQDPVIRSNSASLGGRFFYRREEAQALLESVGPDSTIGDLIKASSMHDLKVYAYLNRMVRENLVRVDRPNA